MVRTGGKGLGARCGPGAGTLNRRSPAGGSRAAAHRAVAERESRTRGPCERIRTKRRGWCAFRAAGNGANDDANPYGNIAWQLELDPAIAEAGRAVRSLLIGPGATHVIQALGLTDAVVVDTVRQFELNSRHPRSGPFRPGLTRASASSLISSVSRLAEQAGHASLAGPRGRGAGKRIGGAGVEG